GSMGSRVPPAETTTWRPARSRPAGPRASTCRATSNSSAGSGSRPGPVSRPVRRPEAGSTTTAPRARRVATFACWYHRLGILLHELAHVVLDHRLDPASDGGGLRRFAPHLPERAARIVA